MSQDARPGGSIFDLLASLRRRRASGMLEFDSGDRARRLHLRDGDLWLAGTHPLARHLGELLEVMARKPTAEARRTLLQIVSRIAEHLADWQTADSRFDDGLANLPADLVGPLPTARLLMIGGVLGAEVADLERRLESLGPRIRSAGDRAAVVDFLGYTPEEQFLLERLRHPLPIQELASGNPFPRDEAIHTLAQLQQLGAIVSEFAAGPDSGGRFEIVSQLGDRIARGLADRPLELDPTTHRQRIAEMMGAHGGLDHYELLGVGTGATVVEIHAGYEDLARTVHPMHAAALQLAGGEEVLKRLFERATLAYETLLDPEQRRRYNERQMIDVPASVVEGEQRDAEVRDMARSQFDRAVAYAAAGDPHNAIQLLQQAVRIDPQPDYWWTLARQLARNPNWRRRAIEAYRQAVMLDPQNVPLRLESGKLFEEAGDPDRARAQYAAVLRISPAHPEATARLTALEPRRREAQAEEPRPGFLARLFRRG